MLRSVLSPMRVSLLQLPVRMSTMQPVQQLRRLQRPSTTPTEHRRGGACAADRLLVSALLVPVRREDGHRERHGLADDARQSGTAVRVSLVQMLYQNDVHAGPEWADEAAGGPESVVLELHSPGNGVLLRRCRAAVRALWATHRKNRATRVLLRTEFMRSQGVSRERSHEHPQ